MQTLSRTRQRSIQTPCPLHLGSEAFLWPDVPKAVTAKPRHPRRANIPQSPGHGRRCPQPGRRSRVSVKGQVRPPRGWERCSVSQGPTRVSGPSISLTHPPTTATTPLPSAHTGRPAQGLRLSPLLWPYRPKHAPTQLRTTLTPPPPTCTCTPCTPTNTPPCTRHARHAHHALARPTSVVSTAGPSEPGAELPCALKIAVSEVMNGEAFALLFLPQLRGLNHVGK